MSTVTRITIYPQNGTTDATTINSDFNAIATATADLNEKNIRQEGIDYRNIGFNPNIQYQSQQYNETEVPFTTAHTTYTTWRYKAYSNAVGGGTKEWAINHNSSPPVTSTAAGDGTKLQLNGTSGITPQPGDIIRLDWTVNVWTTETDTATLLNQVSDLPRASGTHGGGTYGTGSGIGEVFWMVYPKVNVTSNALNDADFQTLTSSGLRGNSAYASIDPKNASVGLANSYALNSAGETRRSWDHVTVIPHMFIAATSSSNAAAIAMYHGDGTVVTDDRYVLMPTQYSGTTTIVVDEAFAGTLYGVELFVSGLWRMKATQVVAGGHDVIASAFLEDQTCNPASDLYGYEGQIYIERANVILTHYTQEGA